MQYKIDRESMEDPLCNEWVIGCETRIDDEKSLYYNVEVSGIDYDELEQEEDIIDFLQCNIVNIVDNIEYATENHSGIVVAQY